MKVLFFGCIFYSSLRFRHTHEINTRNEYCKSKVRTKWFGDNGARFFSLNQFDINIMSHFFDFIIKFSRFFGPFLLHRVFYARFSFGLKNMNQKNFIENISILIFYYLIYSYERHAWAAASDFAKSCVHYISILPGNFQVSASHTDFVKRFIEFLSEHFETEFSRRRLSQQKSNVTIKSIEDETDRVDSTDVPTKQSKQFFLRFCFVVFVVEM